MDITELVSKLKEGGGVVRDPVRLRRKPQKRVRKESLWVDSPEGKESLRNADRRYWRSVSGRWRQLKKEYERRGQKWDISLEDWKRLWEQAGTVLVGEKRIPLFLLRGRDKEAAKVYRIDWEKGWRIDNVVVMYKGSIMANGRKLGSVQQG